jgi:peptide/nickel transport system permease protein
VPRTARVVRSSVIVVRELDFVQAARAGGATDGRILRRHILPNCMAPLIVQLSFVFAYAVLSEAVLSFLGLGAPPTVPSWGILISEGRAYLREAPWLTIVPGVAIAVTALGLNLLGDGLRDVLDPRMKVEQG